MNAVHVCVADEALRSVIEVALRADGWTVASSVNVAAAARMLARRRPDLLILDATMPAFTGADTADAWADRVAPAVPVILLVSAWRDGPVPGRPDAIRLSMPFGLKQLRAALVRAQVGAHPALSR
jgi:DNA-binding NtrC family response regulator